MSETPATPASALTGELKDFGPLTVQPVRDALYRRLGPVEARKRLAARFPGGSAREEIDRRSLAMKDRGESGETGPTVVQQIVEEMGKEG
ncbi:MAG: hypothetical protein D084_Lepto4C00407G0004 [Leptospirillum sp. Group IV 'UBA BS']|nr:MAG: hypothetical protein D084_Lepto4C00407G0004 [Leptospirillum sp. Group IV 'UBA BS']